MAKAKRFQKMGAEIQKATVRAKVHGAMEELRRKRQGVPSLERDEITFAQVVRESHVSSKTLARTYHAKLLQDVHAFLGEINLGVAIAKPKPAPSVRRSSIFKQNEELMQKVGALRFRLNKELSEKQRQIDAMTTRIAALTGEIATLRKCRGSELAKAPSAGNRRRTAA
jgi:hypothetical protein